MLIPIIISNGNTKALTRSKRKEAIKRRDTGFREEKIHKGNSYFIFITKNYDKNYELITFRNIVFSFDPEENSRTLKGR